jgi:hypothetical protein
MRMSKKKVTVDVAHLTMLRGELTKVRCWHTGWSAAHVRPGQSASFGCPGEDGLRQTIMEFDRLIKDAS